MANAVKLNKQRDLILEFLESLGIEKPDEENIVIRQGSKVGAKDSKLSTVYKDPAYYISYHAYDVASDDDIRIDSMEIPDAYLTSSIDECIKTLGWDSWDYELNSHTYDEYKDDKDNKEDKPTEATTADLDRTINENDEGDPDLTPIDLSNHSGNGQIPTDIQIKIEALKIAFDGNKPNRGSISTDEAFYAAEKIYKWLMGQYKVDKSKVASYI